LRPDDHRTRRTGSRIAYKPPADAEGCVILAPHATIKAKFDSTPWRLAMLGAALDAMRKVGVMRF
jgi:hypothetical protein